MSLWAIWIGIRIKTIMYLFRLELKVGSLYYREKSGFMH